MLRCKLELRCDTRNVLSNQGVGLLLTRDTCLFNDVDVMGFVFLSMPG